MTTLHEVLYITQPNLAVKVIVHSEKETGRNGLTRSTDLIYDGPAGVVLNSLLKEKSEALTYGVILYVENGELRITATKGIANVYLVRYECNDGRCSNDRIYAENYNLAHGKAEKVAEKMGYKSFLIGLEKGIG